MKSLMGHLNYVKKGKSLTELTAEQRRERYIKSGGRKSGFKLDFSDRIRKGYRGRVVNDFEGRLETMLEAGWEFVHETKKDVTGSDNKDIGTRVSLPVNADGLRGFLMEIKEEWYDEDQAKKQEKMDKRAYQILKGNVPGASVEHSYIPS